MQRSSPSSQLGGRGLPGIISRKISGTADSTQPWVLVLSIAEENIIRQFLNRTWRDTRGQDLVEYALAAGMVALAAVAAMPQLTGVINNVFSAIGSLINSAVV
jgi:pilus assembly protein Flp/PilA